MRRKRLIFFAALIIAIAVYIYYPTDKKRITKVIVDCKQAIVNENIEQIMEHISFNYSDGRGGSYLTLKKRMEKAFARFDDIDITADIRRVVVDEEQAAAELRISVIVTEGTDRGYIIGDAVGSEDMRVLFEKSPYEWKVLKAEKIVVNN